MISLPIEPLLVWLLVFIRMSLILSLFPLFGEGFVPLRVRILLAGAISLVLAPVVPVTAQSFPKTLLDFGLLGLSEGMLAFSVGLTGRALFGIVQFGAQVTGEQMGFGMINAIDPSSAHQITVVTEVQYMLAVLLFLVSGFHHIFLSAMGQSFDLLAPGQAVATAGLGEYFVHLGAAVFSLGLRFAMPVILVVFLTNVAMAMIGRAVPQLNVFVESFPLRIIGGMVVMIAGLPFVVQLWLRMFAGMESMFAELFGLMRA